jgi:hypothetical protein
MRPFFDNEVGDDQRHNPLAQRLILIVVLGVEDLEPDVKIRVANKNGRILLVGSPALQEPTLVWVQFFGTEIRIQAFDKVPGEMIVDRRAIVFAKDERGLALSIPDDVLPISSRGGQRRESSVRAGSWTISQCPEIARNNRQWSSCNRY